MELTWVDGSTSWFWIRTGGKNIHIDPSYYPKGHARGPEMEEKADLVLVTHSHFDHFQKQTIHDLLGPNTIVIGPGNVVRKLGGIENVKIAEPGAEHGLGWVKIKAVHAYNLGLKGYFMHRKSRCVGYLVTVDGKTIYHAGDTDHIPEMKQLGHVDLALLPIGGTFTMDADGAAEAAKAIGSGLIVPMHNLKTPTIELKTRLDKDPEIQVILADHGRPFTPF